MLAPKAETASIPVTKQLFQIIRFLPKSPR